MDDDVIIIEEYENLDENEAARDFTGKSGHKSHTRLGIICFLIAIGGGLLEFVLFLVFGTASGNSPIDLQGIKTGDIRPIIIVAAVMLLHTTGCLLGILSLIKKEKNRGIPALGILANLAAIGMTVILIGAAWLN
jgi:hypothetical protein